MGLGQFRPHILSLQEQANTVRAGARPGIIQKPGKGGQRPGRHHVIGLVGQIFDPRVFNGDRQGHALGRGAQECGLLADALMQGDGDILAQGGQHQAGKAGARAQIRQGFCLRRDKGGQLGAVPHVPPPQLGQGAGRHQVMAGIPVGQDVGIGLQPRQCLS